MNSLVIDDSLGDISILGNDEDWGVGETTSLRRSISFVNLDEMEYAGELPGENELDEILNIMGCTSIQARSLWIISLSNAADAVEVLAIGFIVAVYKDPVSGKSIGDMPEWSFLLVTMVFFGMLVGGLFSGVFGDRWGRKSMIVYSLALNGASALSSAAAPLLPAGMQLYWIVFFRFLGGLGVGGCTPIAFALASELGPIYSRSLFINIVAIFWSVGSIYVALSAYILLSGSEERGNANWPWFAVAVGVPALATSLISAFFLVESPRFLYDSDRSISRLQLLLLRFNSSSRSWIGNRKRQLASPEDVRRRIEAIDLPPRQVETHTSSAKYFSQNVKILFSSFTRIMIFVSLLFFFLSFAHYGISSWITDLFEHIGFNDPYLTSVFYTAAGVPGLVLAVGVVEYFGSRRLTLLSLLGSGLSALSFGIFGYSNKAVVITFSILFNAFATSAWNAVDIFSAELFPVKFRGSALGVATAFGRIGSTLANLFNAYALGDAIGSEESSVIAVMSAAAVAMFFAATSTYILPNTSEK